MRVSELLLFLSNTARLTSCDPLTTNQPQRKLEGIIGIEILTFKDLPVTGNVASSLFNDG